MKLRHSVGRLWPEGAVSPRESALRAQAVTLLIPQRNQTSASSLSSFVLTTLFLGSERLVLQEIPSIKLNLLLSCRWKKWKTQSILKYKCFLKDAFLAPLKAGNFTQYQVLKGLKAHLSLWFIPQSQVNTVGEEGRGSRSCVAAMGRASPWPRWNAPRGAFSLSKYC